MQTIWNIKNLWCPLQIKQEKYVTMGRGLNGFRQKKTRHKSIDSLQNTVLNVMWRENYYFTNKVTWVFLLIVKGRNLSAAPKRSPQCRHYRFCHQLQSGFILFILNIHIWVNRCSMQAHKSCFVLQYHRCPSGGVEILECIIATEKTFEDNRFKIVDMHKA